MESIDTEKIRMAADIGICAIIDGRLNIILIDWAGDARYEADPYKGRKVLPGGLLHVSAGETIEDTVHRIIRKKIGLNFDGIYIEQLKTYTRVNRDYRDRSIAVGHFALVPYDKISDIPKELFFPIDDIKEEDLGFDHYEMICDIKERLKGKIWYTDVSFSLVPKKFTLSKLQNVFEIILGEKLVPYSFRKKLFSNFNIVELNEMAEMTGAGRPSRLMTYLKE